MTRLLPKVKIKSKAVARSLAFVVALFICFEIGTVPHFGFLDANNSLRNGHIGHELWTGEDKFHATLTDGVSRPSSVIDIEQITQEHRAAASSSSQEECHDTSHRNFASSFVQIGGPETKQGSKPPAPIDPVNPIKDGADEVSKVLEKTFNIYRGSLQRREIEMTVLLVIGATVLLLAFFVVLRRIPVFKGLYNFACQNGKRPSVTEEQWDSWFGWIRPVFYMPDREVLEFCNDDSLLMVKFMREFTLWFFVIMLINCSLLIPLRIALTLGDSGSSDDQSLQKQDIEHVMKGSVLLIKTMMIPSFDPVKQQKKDDSNPQPPPESSPDGNNGDNPVEGSGMSGQESSRLLGDGEPAKVSRQVAHYRTEDIVAGVILTYVNSLIFMFMIYRIVRYAVRLRVSYLKTRAEHPSAVLVTNIPYIVRTDKELYNFFDRYYPGGVHYTAITKNTARLARLTHQRTSARTHLRDFLRDWMLSDYPTSSRRMIENMRAKMITFHDLTREMNLEREIMERSLREMSSASEFGTTNGIVIFKNIEHAHMACQLQLASKSTEWTLSLQDDDTDLLWSSMQNKAQWWRPWLSYLILAATFVGGCFLVHAAQVVVCSIFGINYRPEVETIFNYMKDNLILRKDNKEHDTMEWLRRLYDWLVDHADFTDYGATDAKDSIEQKVIKNFFHLAQIVAQMHDKSDIDVSVDDFSSLTHTALTEALTKAQDKKPLPEGSEKPFELEDVTWFQCARIQHTFPAEIDGHVLMLGDNPEDGFLGAFKTANTFENFVVSSAPSATISLLQALVGPICVGLLKFERVLTQKQVERRTLPRVWGWYVMFIIVFYFLFTFNSSVQARFGKDKDDDGSGGNIFSFLLVDVVERLDYIRQEALANQLVTSCLFFMTYLAYQFLSLGISIVHPGNLLWLLALRVWHWVRNRCSRGLTEGRFYQDTKIIINYLYPIWMHPSVFYGKMIFVASLCLMYSIICPLVLPVGFLIGAYGWFTHRYNVIMNWHQPFSFGGAMVPEVYSALLRGLYMFQWLMFAVLFLASPEVFIFICMLPVFLLTRMFDKFIRRNKFGEFLSLEELQGLSPPSPQSLQRAEEKFTQPCFRAAAPDLGTEMAMDENEESADEGIQEAYHRALDVLAAHPLPGEDDVDDDSEHGEHAALFLESGRSRYGLMSSHHSPSEI